jgi:hypothetical protein
VAPVSASLSVIVGSADDGDHILTIEKSVRILKAVLCGIGMVNEYAPCGPEPQVGRALKFLRPEPAGFPPLITYGHPAKLSHVSSSRVGSVPQAPNGSFGGGVPRKRKPRM